MFMVFFFLQYIPSVEDTVLGIVVDTKPDVSIHLYSGVCELILVSRYLSEATMDNGCQNYNYVLWSNIFMIFFLNKRKELCVISLSRKNIGETRLAKPLIQG